MVGLLDVNVLVALVVPEHEHHVQAFDWLMTEGLADGWASCVVTELGVVRVCAQLPGGAWPPDRTCREIWWLMGTGPEHTFWRDPESPLTMPEVRAAKTGKQITDRYLVAIARRNGGRLVTFDRALSAVGGDDVVCLLADS